MSQYDESGRPISTEAPAEVGGALDVTDEELEVARRAVEDALIELRDARISTLRKNGLVIAEKGGSRSDIIRMGTEDAIRIGLEAIQKHRQETT